ncbi:unnamed protein product [Musa banksii]
MMNLSGSRIFPFMPSMTGSKHHLLCRQDFQVLCSCASCDMSDKRM